MAKHSPTPCLSILLSSALGLFLSLNAVAATFSVTTLADAGPGSLRQALLNANASAGSSVAFEVAGTIALNAPLPIISRTMDVDGTTAPGYQGEPVVSVDFAGNPGIVIARGAQGATIEGLSLVRSSSAALVLQAGGNTIAGNYIGIGLDGRGFETMRRAKPTT